MEKVITYGLVESLSDLEAIRALQGKNLPGAISKEEALAQGFVTVQHDLDLLEEMNQPYPHIVARDRGEIVGYTLVMLREFSKRIPILIPMFKEIDATRYQGKLLKDALYLVMGQVCIAKGYRGQGIFARLYQEMKRHMSIDFEYLITEVSVRNARSMRAHEKVGFQRIKEYNSGGEDWVVLLLELKS